MAKLLQALAIAALTLCATVAARAQTAPQVAFDVGAATDYMFRGVDRSDRRGQLFAEADLAYKDGYAGAFTSNVDFARLGDARVDQEVDLYGGWRPEFKGYELDFGLIYYGFVNQARGAHDDYAEASARIGRSIGPVSGAVSLHYSPQAQGHVGAGWYSEASAAYAVTRTVTASALVGRQTLQRGASDYTVWSLGATWSFAPHLGLELRYWDTDAHGSGEPYEGKLAASLKASF